jgi:UrcA family protein
MSKLLLAATAALLLAGPALAETQDGAAPTQTVSVRGADLNNAAQARDVYVKLWRAAYSVCDSNSVNPVIAQADLTCVRQAMSQAVQTLNAPRVTAMLDRNMGRDASVYQAAAH